MRHNKNFNHLGRQAGHRKALMSNMASSLILHKRIETTVAKAKALRQFIEPLVTKSKEDTTHQRRMVFSYLKQKEAVTELCRTIAPKIAERPGGYTRILKTSGVIGLHSAVFVLFGQNIGTCITAVLASVGTNRNAKRTTAIHLMFNVVGTVIFVVLCMVTPFVDWMITTNPANPAAQIANVHTIFNIATTVILFPFGPMLVNIAKKILPDTQVKHVMDADQWFEGLMASKHHLGVSTIAISQIHEEIRDMLAIAASNVSDSFKAMEQGPGENGIQEIADREEEIDLSNVRLSKKISKVLVLDQTPQDIEALNKMYSILGNIERIGDHAMNLAEYAQTIQEKNLNFSDYAKNEFKVMDESCALGMELLRKAAAGDSDFTLEKIQAIEQKIDDITDNFRQNQIDRMREGHCNVESSILYSEMLTDYERIGDHMLNIGEAYDAIQWNSDKAAALAEE